MKTFSAIITLKFSGELKYQNKRRNGKIAFSIVKFRENVQIIHFGSNYKKQEKYFHKYVICYPKENCLERIMLEEMKP